MFICSYCSYRLKNKIFFIKHLFDTHNTEASFRYLCKISSCSHAFVSGDTFNAFRNHCMRYHHNWKERINLREEESVLCEINDDDLNVDTLTTEDTVDDVDEQLVSEVTLTRECSPSHDLIVNAA